MLTVGMMAKHYHVLPSVIMEQATTYDLLVFNSVMAWEQEQQDRAAGKKPVPKVSTEQMTAMLERVRSKQNGINQQKN
jgi:hypothetical protein